jgi:small subunit ribosomal protein S4
MISIQCKKCRRVGEKLFLKGDRCYTPKCALVKRAYPPGVHGKRRGGLSEYGKQLLEKQKIRHTYGILEKQFRKYVEGISGRQGDKRELLFRKLEKRLDNVIFRLGLAQSRRKAKQIVSHSHILVNGKKMNIPSYEVKVKDRISVKSRSQALPIFKDLKEILQKRQIPQWLSLNVEKMEATIIADTPDINQDILQSLGLIIEFYSR